MLRRVWEHLLPNPPSRLGVAVSGGGDSIALLHMMAALRSEHDVEVFAVTINHGLRPEAKAEAEVVADFARSMDVSHDILNWSGWQSKGNLQDLARRARYGLMAQWAHDRGIRVIALGHTADDQAETVLMRLARSAGVDGLAGMPQRRILDGVTFIRPLMQQNREALRDYLLNRGISWIEDPSNEDERFDRVKARKAMIALQDLGITAEKLTRVAGHLSQAREALDWFSFLSAREMVKVVSGDIAIEIKRFRTLPDEVARRIVNRAIKWISGAEYPARRAAVNFVLNAARDGRAVTLDGCHALQYQGHLWICREYNSVRKQSCDLGDIWDNRWSVVGPDGATGTIRALGEDGLEMCPNWRNLSHPRVALLAAVSVWDGDKLVAAPTVRHDVGWSATLVGGSEDFYASLLSH